MKIGFLNQVFSHHWHWKKIPYKKEFDEFTLKLPGIEDSISKDLPFQGAIAHMGGRLYGYLIEADTNHPSYQNTNTDIYFGFRQPWQSEHINVLEIPLENKSLALAGKEDCFIYLLDQNLKPIPAKVKTNPKSHKPQLISRRYLDQNIWVI